MPQSLKQLMDMDGRSRSHHASVSVTLFSLFTNVCVLAAQKRASDSPRAAITSRSGCARSEASDLSAGAIDAAVEIADGVWQKALVKASSSETTA